MTNYDQIRNMSVEDMAEFLMRWDEDWEEWVVSDGTKFNDGDYDKALAHEIKWLLKENATDRN